jgi:quinol-cytochrome oxidoreductase complex cytochrome b subunit
MASAHEYHWKNPTVAWIDKRLPIFSLMRADLVDYPTPKNLNYFWNFGSLAGIVLIIMIATGIFLAMHYTPHTSMAFESVERIMRDVNYGWLIRYLHMNGASMFFIVVFIHMFRGLYYGSYKAPREILWMIGVIILLAMMATAFMGYVLPWGQMSFWGATVITNLFSAIPVIGESIVIWLWGGFSVDNATLNRFFALHYLLPFIIFGLVFVHLWALHTVKSNNPLGIDVKGPQDTVPFTPYYTIKDMFGLGVFLLFYLAFVFFAPNYLGHPDNYIKANPLVTPAHIVPEWYFLPFYAILRAITFDIWFIPAKLLGVIAMFASVLILLFLPWLDRSPVRSARFRPVYKWLFWLFALNCVVLGYVGSQPPEGIFVLLGQVTTALYFAFFLIAMPLLSFLERPKPLPASISAPVTPGGVGVLARGAAE